MLYLISGDVFVYSYSQKSPIPVRTLQNENTQNDAVIDITWSVDSSRLITINETVRFRVQGSGFKVQGNMTLSPLISYCTFLAY